MEYFEILKAVNKWAGFISLAIKTKNVVAEKCPNHHIVYYSFYDVNNRPIHHVEVRIYVLTDLWGTTLESPLIFNTGDSNQIGIPYPGQLITPYGYYTENIHEEFHTFVNRCNWHIKPCKGSIVDPSFRDIKLNKHINPVAKVMDVKLEQKKFTNFHTDIPYILCRNLIMSPFRASYVASNKELKVYNINVIVNAILSKSNKITGKATKSVTIDADTIREVSLPLKLSESGIYDLFIKTKVYGKSVENNYGPTFVKKLSIEYGKSNNAVRVL